MVTAKLVRARKSLRQRDVGGGCGVYFDGRGARCRENLSRCYGEGEDVGDVSFEILAWTERRRGSLNYHHLSYAL
jgi:hypothetical protein